MREYDKEDHAVLLILMILRDVQNKHCTGFSADFGKDIKYFEGNFGINKNDDKKVKKKFITWYFHQSSKRCNFQYNESAKQAYPI